MAAYRDRGLQQEVAYTPQPPHLDRELDMSQEIVQTVTITGDSVRRGDVISVGGIPHVVADVREVNGRRKLLRFEDGNTYVLPRVMTIEVTRVYIPRRTAAPVQGRMTVPGKAGAQAQPARRMLGAALGTRY